MTIVLPLLSVAPDSQNIGPFEMFRRLQNLCFPFPFASTTILVSAWVAHFAEARYALTVAEELELKPKHASSWFRWTLTLGFPCLRWLLCLRSARPSDPTPKKCPHLCCVSFAPHRHPLLRHVFASVRVRAWACAADVTA